MPDIFKLAAQDMAWLYRQVRIFALQCLYTSQLIHADRAFPLFGSFSGLGINLTALDDFLFPSLISNLGQPIPEMVRLQPSFFSKYERCS